MNGFSIIMPCEKERLPLLRNTLIEYKKSKYRGSIEFIVISRTISFGDLHEYSSMNISVINYTFEHEYFNPAMALNIGVAESMFNNIIITCPEVKPRTDVLYQLSQLKEGNYLCQVWDVDKEGRSLMSLVNSNFRSNTPAMYFLALFQKEDLLKINGWDEEFMKGYAYEDNDFGDRFNRAGLKFEMRDEIQAEHQWHARHSLGSEGAKLNRKQYINNTTNKITFCKNGLDKYMVK